MFLEHDIVNTIVLTNEKANIYADNFSLNLPTIFKTIFRISAAKRIPVR